MRKKPRYNDKRSRQMYDHFFYPPIGFDNIALFWPCELKETPNKIVNRKPVSKTIKLSDSRSGMKGITIRKRLGKL